MSEDTDPTVLVVDDEPNITALFETWLADDYRVVTANDGSEALERVDDGVDVALLDRRMPGRSGDDVLSAIRDGGYDVRVAMVTAVEPDLDVVEMPFDDYLTKPVDREDLESVVRGLLARKQYEEDVQEYYSLAATKAALESSRPTAELVETPEYEALIDDLETLETTVDERLAETDDYVSAFMDL